MKTSMVAAVSEEKPTGLSEEELQELKKRADESPVGYADSKWITCDNCKIIDMLDGSILIVPYNKGEHK